MYFLQYLNSPSRYTDKVDAVLAETPKQVQRKLTLQMRQMCAMLSGMIVGQDFNEGQELMKSRDFKKHRAFFQSVR
jgi:hypothetical protein